MSIVVIRSGDSPEHIRAALDAAQAGIESADPRPFDPERHLATIELRENPVTIQRRMRDAWDERSR